MTAYEQLKILHVSCALLSICGFALRGYWKLTGNTLLALPPVKIVPHVLDSALLLSAIGMLVILELPLGQLPWVIAKLVALLFYIGLGMVVMRFGRTRRAQLIAYCLALLTAAYILSVARFHSPLGVLVLVV